MFGVSDVGDRKLLFHIYPDPPFPSIPSLLADPWKVIEKEQKFNKTILLKHLSLCPFRELKKSLQ